MKINTFTVCSSLEFTVKVLIFVGINFRGLGEKHQFVDFLIRGFDDAVIEFKVNNPFNWESNFVVYLTNKIHKKLVLHKQ